MNKKVKEMLTEQYGYAPDLIFEVKPNRRIYAYKPCPFNPKVHTEKGIYFGKIESDGIRLTIEGAFLVGSKGQKNIVEVDEEKAKLWLAGKDLKTNEEINGWVILKWGQYYLGCGKAKEGIIKNYVPKERRINLE
ncbi:hypothetical protein E3E22_08770 [Thermococcus sp. MV5]|uniref:methyltransferase RsmF C-terminal domain-like protein n=1 Tax=Thermococcus sp. MV5 TaxID=1638272 RepID=UPI001439B311|nr:hypothetical protein [Thermococcus sp. MV5]NJE26706.1 hypothetical protein [Thermococcus sp. MV5]